MDTLPISKFKATCLAALERVRKTGRPLRVTRFGRPVADIVPPSGAEANRDWLGRYASSATIEGDLLAPLEADWESLRK
jgi:antitoxin (DNA-binding transcriptional repressor) of toxin-antitoxin stability system